MISQEVDQIQNTFQIQMKVNKMTNKWIQFCQFRDCNEIALDNPKNKIISGWSVNVFCCENHEERCELFIDDLNEEQKIRDKILGY